MTYENRYYNEAFTATLGSLGRSRAMDAEYSRVMQGFFLLQAEMDTLLATGGRRFTQLIDCPDSFTGQALKWVRLNAAGTALEFAPQGVLGIKSVAGTSYTLVAADANYRLLFTNSAGCTVTVPPDVFAQGESVLLCQAGTDRITLVAGSGVTLNSTDGLLQSRTQHAWLAIVCDASNTFGVGGERNSPTLDVYADIQMSCSDLTTSLTTGTSKAYCRAPHAMTITGVRASLLTASTSGAVTVDININGTTILSTKLTLDQDEKTSLTAAVAAVLSGTTLADDDEITVDIDGAGTGAKGLIVTIRGALA